MARGLEDVGLAGLGGTYVISFALLLDAVPVWKQLGSKQDVTANSPPRAPVIATATASHVVPELDAVRSAAVLPDAPCVTDEHRVTRSSPRRHFIKINAVAPVIAGVTKTGNNRRGIRSTFQY